MSKRLNKIYRKILSRVNNPQATGYHDYGGRSITVCQEWKDSFEAFRDWALANGYKDNLSIDRKDNDGNYEPSNCRWTTQTVQSRNTRILYAHNKSGYRGVRYRKDRNKWSAQITINNKSVALGTYETAIEAGQAYDTFVFLNDLEHTTNGLITKEEATHTQISIKRQSAKTSTHQGVSFDGFSKRWYATKRDGNKTVFRKSFKTEQEAINAITKFNLKRNTQ